jgi:sugar/nucleoside kinase (ribokinase family)
MQIRPILRELNELLPSLADKVDGYRALVGFDGFVDRIQHIVQNRELNQVAHFQTIATFASHLSTLAGKSGQVEVDTQETKLGGNAPIMANALGSLGIRNYVVASIDDPVFAQMHPLCQHVPLGPAASTNAFEFLDGKLMFSDMGPFAHLTWEKVKSVVSPPSLRAYALESQLLAFVDWANMPHCTGIWQGLLDEVVQYLPQDQPKKFLFDICDPSRNTPEAIREVLEVVSAYSAFGNVTLGMNENEAQKIWLVLNGYSPNDAGAFAQVPKLDEASNFIFHQLKVHTLLVHPVDRSIACTSAGTLELPGRVVERPKILTGGGDNLNAGFCLGLLAGLSLPHCMVLGMANSGAYIQNGFSPGLHELRNYLLAWERGL